ncbi:hypothetical protein ACFX2H_022708 [Malus domestica]
MPRKKKLQVVSSPKKSDVKRLEHLTSEESGASSKGSNTLVLQYILVSRRKNRQSPFKKETKNNHARKLEKEDVKLLKAATVVTLPTLNNPNVSKPSLPSFVRIMQNMTERGFLPTKRTEKGYDPNAYKLMSRAEYDFTSSSTLGNKDLGIIGERKHELTETQRKLKERGYEVNFTKASLSFTPIAPIKISSKGKDKKVSTQHINVDVMEDDEEESKPVP